MARNDGIDRTVARHQFLASADDVVKTQKHNERDKDEYSNPDIIPERSPMNVHYKAPDGDYQEMFQRMEQEGVISTRGLKTDAVKFCELVLDVNSAYFHNHGGYEFAKQFYADAYQAAVKIVGGEEYILSAVMHADERNTGISDKLGEDVYHYHLHVVYILKSSYSVLQDDFFQYIRSAGYTDVERGERFSTEEHLTITQFKVLAEKERLTAVTGQVEQAEQELDDVTSATEEQKKKLAALKKETKVAQKVSLTVHEIEDIGKKNPLTGNISMTAEQCDALKRCAITGIAAKAENRRLQNKLTTAEKDISIWKQRYETLSEKFEALKKKAQPYLDALEIASEKVRAFIDSLLTLGRRPLKQHDHQHKQETGHETTRR